jgi:predicted outer membrane repeat protein
LAAFKPSAIDKGRANRCQYSEFYEENFMRTRRQVIASASALAAAGWSTSVPARDGYPQNTVRVLVPFPAGGNTDGNARLVAQWLGERLGATFVIDNQAGAGGAIAAKTVARAEPDGYTLFFSALPQIAILPAMEKVGYDPVRDFAPISAIGTNPFVLLVHPSIPARTLKEFVDYVAQRPGKLNYASAGIGSLAHLSMVLLLRRAGLDMIHVPYKGDAPAMIDLLGGQVPVYFGNLSVAAPQVKGGAIRALAISDDHRSDQLPDVPTVAVAGYPGFRTITWNGLLAPAATPKPIIDVLAGEMALAAKDPAFVKRLQAYGVDPLGNTPAEFAASIGKDIKTWSDAVAAEGLAAK